MELIQNLNKKLTEKYSGVFAELNRGVYIAAKLDNGNFEAPTISLSGGGATVLITKDQELNKAAEVSVSMTELLPIDVIYRILLPLNEVEIADKNPAYFDYFFGKVLQKALTNYKAAFGNPSDVRFGQSFVNVSVIEFKASKTDNKDSSGFIELRLTGSWASDKAANDGKQG